MIFKPKMNSHIHLFVHQSKTRYSNIVQSFFKGKKILSKKQIQNTRGTQG
jgi:hypothetical protein